MEVIDAGMSLFDMCAKPVQVVATNAARAVAGIRVRPGFVSVPAYAA